METSGRHRGYHDPADPEVELLTPKIYARRHGLDLNGRRSVSVPVRGPLDEQEVELEFVELQFGRRPYFICPDCETRRHKLLRPPGQAEFSCRTCWEDAEVVRYACRLRHREDRWETFEKDLHQARKYEKVLAYTRARGTRRRRLKAAAIVHRLDAEQGRREYEAAQWDGLLDEIG